MWLSSLSLHLLYCFQLLGRLWSRCEATSHSDRSYLGSVFIIDQYFQPKSIVTQWSSVESWTLKLAPTWYAKLEHKPRNHPEERALVVETILDESIEPVNAQGCQRPSNLAAKLQLVPDIKCTSMTIGVSLTSVTNSAVNSWGAGGSWAAAAAARRQPGRSSSRDAILLSAEMLLPGQNLKVCNHFLERGGASKCLVKMKTLLQFWHLRLQEYLMLSKIQPLLLVNPPNW